MDLNALLASMQGCPCGKPHHFAVKTIEIESGLTARTGQILSACDFPKRILLVADQNTLAAANGILESLRAGGFSAKQLIYENLLYARVEQVREVEALAEDVDGILSVGTGSLNDICRVAAYRKKKRFCIFATAPSMDGFASDTAPIIENNFKTSWQAEQPEIILADTAVLAKAPSILKSSGFGDMIAKYIALVDWRVSHLLTGEYYCERIAALTEEALTRITALADRVTSEDEAAAGAIMEALILTGLAMKLAGCSRPASGAEHVISHYWECHKVIRGIWPEFHGRKVGVATLLCWKLYLRFAELLPTLTPHADATDWADVYAHYDPKMLDGVRQTNQPTVTEGILPQTLQENAEKIAEIIRTTLPNYDTVVSLMKRAGAATEPEQIHVTPEFLADGLRYHAYMRHRVLITRLLPMYRLDPVSLLSDD